MFDWDRDGLLSRAELTRAVELLLQVQEENRIVSTHVPVGAREDGGVAAAGETGTNSQPQVSNAHTHTHTHQSEGTSTRRCYKYIQWVVRRTNVANLQIWNSVPGILAKPLNMQFSYFCKLNSEYTVRTPHCSCCQSLLDWNLITHKIFPGSEDFMQIANHGARQSTFVILCSSPN